MSAELKPTPNSGLISWFAHNAVAANLLMLIIFIAGIFSMHTINNSLMPEFRLSAIVVKVVYPGAGPEEVEQGVVLKIEEAIQAKNIRGVEKMNSVSHDSLAQVTIEVDDKADINDISNQIKLAIDGIDSFPPEVEKPSIEKEEQSIPAINIQIFGPGLDEHLAKRLANQTREELLADPDISKIVLYGERESEVVVEVSEQQLRKYALTLKQIANAINAASVDLPAGAIKSEKGDLLIYAKGRAYKKAEFEKIPIYTSLDGKRLLLGDIATISETFEEKLNSNNFDGKYSTGLGIFAVGDEDIVKAANAAKKYVDDFQSKLPNGVKMVYWGQTVKYLEDRLHLMYEDMAQGALLVLFMLALFMRLSTAFWVMLGIPICFLGTMIALPFFDITLNMISLFGFIMVLGIVVDDAIIISESAHASMHKENSSSIETVMRGIDRVAIPAIFGVLTTICAFAPTIFISGKWGNFPAACGYVVIFCLLFSMLESKLILPAHVAHTSIVSKLLDWRWQNSLQERSNAYLRKFITHQYQPFLRAALKARYITVSVFLAMLLIVFALLKGGWVRYVLSPEVPSDYLRASLVMPQGTTDAQVQQYARHIEQALLHVDKQYMQQSAANKSFIAHRFTYNIGINNRTTVELVDVEQRHIRSDEILKRWKKATGEIIGAKSLIFSDAQDENIGIVSDVAFDLNSRDEHELYAAAKELKAYMLSYDGVTSVLDGVPESVDQVQFSLKPAGQALGLTLGSVAMQVREAFYGAQARSLQKQNEEVKIKVRYPKEERKTINDLNELFVRTPDGRGVPIASVVDLTVKPSMVERVRLNGKQALSVSAKVDKSFAEPKKIAAAIEKEFLPKFTKKYPGLEINTSGGSKDDSDMEAQLFFGFILSLFGIYALLAVPLKSYIQPLIIMSVIPFGIIGAVVGHMIMGLAVSMMSIFGIIALSGVVVTDSLLIVNFMNEALEKETSLFDAVVNAGGDRFRAIMLTSLTTFFGILPIVLESSVQAQFIIPMAVSMGFGSIFSTAITLILIPCFYMLLEDTRNFMKKDKSMQASAA